jgi:predicted metal-binding membrane protein
MGPWDKRGGGLVCINPYDHVLITMNSAVHVNRPPTILESALLSYNRTSAVVLLVVLPLVSWAWIVLMSRDMYGPMTGASAWTMTARWDMPHLLLLWAMWAVMMVGMMLPSASPMLLLYGVVARRVPSGRSAGAQVYALASGYLIVWAAFSFGATALQRMLAELLLVSPMMEITSPRLGGTLLVIAGVYQLTPIKYTCLRNCRSPLGLLMSGWRSGMSGAFRMGIKHGAYCVGCCWALMLLLFAGGVMNLIVIAALTLFVAFEKLAPFGLLGARISGILLILAGSWMILHSPVHVP